MSVVDVSQLLTELSADAPSGADLEYDPAFGELERATQGKPEQQFGDTIIPAEDPDWTAVKNKALELLGRTRDLRVAAHLAAALIHTDGLGGLGDGLSLTRGLVEHLWDSVHPQLDPDDDNDPTLRVNTVAALADPETMLRAVREAPLVSSRGFGTFSLRDVMIANGTLQAPGEGEGAPTDLATIDAAFMECDAADLQRTAEAVELTLGEVRGLEAALTERVGAGQGADLGELAKLLRAAQQVLTERLSRRGLGDVEAAAPEAGGAPEPTAEGKETAVGQVPGVIRSREDVIRVLDQACDYFQRSEPSSPVPLLLKRAKRLISKDFLEIVRDLAPDGVAQIELIRGTESSE